MYWHPRAGVPSNVGDGAMVMSQEIGESSLLFFFSSFFLLYFYDKVVWI
jgi:hypothetical protein